MFWVLKREAAKQRGRENAEKERAAQLEKERAAQLEKLAEFARLQMEQKEREEREKELKRQEQKEKLNLFKQTRDQLQDRLKDKFATKDWKSLKSVLDNPDKGVVGIYVLHNKTRGRYYVGQAKQLNVRIRNHFEVEQIALDYLAGDEIEVKTLTAAELGDDYRLDHVEKTGIEIFGADKTGYNRNKGII